MSGRRSGSLPTPAGVTPRPRPSQPVSAVSLVRHPGRPSFALVGPRGLTVAFRRAARGLYAIKHQAHRPHQAQPCIRGSQRRALDIATRYARRFA